jgi:SAM-dependent methyltransferase
MPETSAHRLDPKSGSRRFLRWAALGLALIVGISAAMFLLLAAAQEGYLGAKAQNWVRIEKSRFIFDRLYSMADPPFDREPNRTLVRYAENAAPGTALDIAAGQGRNSIFLANKGWKVTAFDISGKGLEIAQTAAREVGVPLTTVRCSAQEFNYGHHAWDLVLLVYAPIPFDDLDLLERIQDSIKPGGVLLIDTPVMMHHPPDGRPRVPGDLERRELPSLFPDLEVIYYTESEDRTEWLNMTMPIARLLAQKPGA